MPKLTSVSLIVAALLVFSVAVASGAISATSASASVDLQLTTQEQQWLKENPIIIYGADEDFAPIDFLDAKGEVIGISRSFLEVIETYLGVTFVYRSDKWDRTLQKLDSGDVDFVNASVTAEREKTKLFTRELMFIPSAIITRKDNYTIQKPSDLIGMRVSTVEGWSWNDDLKVDYPEIILVPYPSLLEAFNAVAFGEVDATVQDLAVAGYVIELNKITTLKMAATYPLPLDLRFMVSKDQPELHAILDKAIAAIPKHQVDDIYSKWIYLKSVPFYQTEGFFIFLITVSVIILLSLAWSFFLKAEVSRQTHALKKSNDELESSIENLQVLQRQMVDQEKMAALGSLVAGISHEVNAPLGTILMAVTALESNTQQLATLFEDKELSISDLEEHLTDLTESLQILHRSTERAIDIMQNMKTLSADQMQDAREVFDLSDYMHKIKANLKYECRKKQVDLRIIVPDSLMVDTYPGILSQLFTNLILNSLIHGFEDRLGGTIEISVNVQDDSLIFHYRDNGCGMDAQTLERMYNAFFTTRKHHGGTGLGMHIVRSLVEQKFKGDIHCTSVYGQGTEFTITLPKETWSVH
jgi:signal transduction histidine kinase